MSLVLFIFSFDFILPFTFRKEVLGFNLRQSLFNTVLTNSASLVFKAIYGYLITFILFRYLN